MTDFQLKTYSEIVFSVKNIQQVASLYTEKLGWEIVSHSFGVTSQIQFWDLPSECETEEILLQFQGLDYGQLRLIEYKNVPQKLIRPAGQTWDTGGILDIDLRTSDIQKTFDEMLEAGWHGYSQPVSQTMGPFTLEEVLLKGHDEVVIAFIHRSEPPHPNPFNLEGITSNIYLTAMIVKDLEVAAHFFINQLGFMLHNEISFSNPAPSRSMFGLPHNLADKIPIKLKIIGPMENRDGLMDLVQLEGVTGEDFSANGCPPNRGILMYRFPVDNVEAYYQFIKNNGVIPVRALQVIDIQPYGKVKIFAVQSPDGVWLEFFECL